MPELKDVIRDLATELNFRFTPPQFIPGCQVNSVDDKDEFQTNNGWIEANVREHGQQRVRYFGWPQNIGTGNYVDVEYWSEIKQYRISSINQGGTLATGGAVLVDKVFTPDFTGTVLYTDNGGTAYFTDQVVIRDSAGTARITLDPGTPSTEAFWETRDQTGALKLRLSTDNVYRFLVSNGGVDTNQNVFMVDVTDNPACLWSNDNDRFQWNKGHEVTAGDVLIPDDLVHYGDPDTLRSFTDDAIADQAGGVVMLRMTETTQDLVEIGDVGGGGDVDVNINDGQVLIEGSSGEVTVTANVSANAHAFIVKNTSSATASAGDVGYIDNAGEYQTTTTELADVSWCVVLIGGANNADIYVARRGRVTVNYTGSAPSTGDFLVTSTTAGSAQAQTTMRPEIFAVCLANGSGGTVSALLLTQRVRKPLAIANELFQIVNASDSDFVAVIATAGVSGDKVYHDPPSSGTQDAVTPFANNHISKIVLHNTTQGEEAFVIAAGTDATDDYIQVSDSADISGWVTTDTITARSQTNTSTISSTYFFDMEITDLDNVPPLTTILDISVHRLVDTGSTGQQGNLHPFEVSATPKRKTIRTIQTTSVGGSPGIVRSLPIFQNRYQIEWDASGSGTMQVQLRLEACEVAAP